MDFIIDTDDSFKELKCMLDSKEATLESLSENVASIVINKKRYRIELQTKYVPQLSDVNRLVFGKNDTKGIVNISVKNDNVHIFNIDGTETVLPYKHWVLSQKKFTDDFKPLIGNQWFKYIKEYDHLPDFLSVKNNVYKAGMYTIANYEESFMVKNGYTYYKGMKIDQLSMLSFDIETTGLNPFADDAEVLLITNTYRDKDNHIQKVFVVDDYASDVDMILAWADWVKSVNPSILLGHNIIIFDIPYITNRLMNEGYTLDIGRDGSPLVTEDRVRELRVDGTQTYSYHRLMCFGRDIIDTFFLAIKADIGKKYESYGLKSIVKQEGLEKEGRQHYDASLIRSNWSIPEEKEKIIAYASDDSEDPLKLFDLMAPSFFYLTQYVPKTFQMMLESATGSQINSMMVRSYIQDGYSVAKTDAGQDFVGAISNAKPGIYNNCVRWDVASLYPSIMIQYRIEPTGKDFNRNFLKMLDYFLTERLKNKQLAKTTGERHYKDLEQSQKIFANSTYGFLGANGLNYNHPASAAMVTRYGREILTKAVVWASGKTPEEIYG